MKTALLGVFLFTIYVIEANAECYGVSAECYTSYSSMMDSGQPDQSLYDYSGPDYSAGYGSDNSLDVPYYERQDYSVDYSQPFRNPFSID